jgi:hypothetical protein
MAESWQCIDCGRNTAPGIKNRAQTEQAFQIQKLMGKDGSVSMELNDESEVYHLRDAVWKAAGMAPFDGCYASAVSKSGSVAISRLRGMGSFAGQKVVICWPAGEPLPR